MISYDELKQIYRGRKVLITGGAGFIGSNLARRLADFGADVTVVDSSIPDYGGNLFNLSGYENSVRLNIADVRDQYSMNYLIRDQDYLFNLAGQVSHTDSMQNPYTDLEINDAPRYRFWKLVEGIIHPFASCLLLRDRFTASQCICQPMKNTR